MSPFAAAKRNLQACCARVHGRGEPTKGKGGADQPSVACDEQSCCHVGGCRLEPRGHRSALHAGGATAAKHAGAAGGGQPGPGPGRCRRRRLQGGMPSSTLREECHAWGAARHARPCAAGAATHACSTCNKVGVVVGAADLPPPAKASAGPMARHPKPQTTLFLKQCCSHASPLRALQGSVTLRFEAPRSPQPTLRHRRGARAARVCTPPPPTPCCRVVSPLPARRARCSPCCVSWPCWVSAGRGSQPAHGCCQVRGRACRRQAGGQGGGRGEAGSLQRERAQARATGLPVLPPPRAAVPVLQRVRAQAGAVKKPVAVGKG
jgi:hypothetical protein